MDDDGVDDDEDGGGGCSGSYLLQPATDQYRTGAEKWTFVAQKVRKVQTATSMHIFKKCI